MCGICGIFRPGGLNPGEADSLAAMNASLAHRGPDDAGLWSDPASGVGLGHRRLAILDLSPLGRQPMASASGRYTLCFNGEVYNFARLRAELEPLGHRFRGGSDTEVMLAAFEQWGLDAALAKFIGMFAFALWDAREATLSLARDRLGVKPLYLGRLSGGGGQQGQQGWVFGSELRALRAHADFDRGLDRGALALYLRHNYIPAPHSVHAAARKVLPGEVVVLSAAGEASRRYWSAEDLWRAGFARPLDLPEAEALERLEALLTDAVGLRMLADVPLGSFLSGGIDSSLVTALMQKQSAQPVRSFSIGFAEAAFDEAPHARAVAAHLGCAHTELTVTAQDLLDLAPRMGAVYDEPFADSSQIPTTILCALTRRHVTVALSGDGGDELFSGYARYPWTLGAHRALSCVPGPLRGAALALGRGLPAGLWRLLGPLGPRLRWRLDALSVRGFEALYRHFVSLEKDPARLLPGVAEPENRAFPAPLGDSTEARRAWMGLADILGYLPDDILTKVDRASMAVALEARNPLLDHRVLEFAARLPLGLKVQGGAGKHLLRRILYRHVPRTLVDRPKMGFGVPLAAWLRGGLRQWAGDLLSPARLARQGLLDAARVQDLWTRYLAGEDALCHNLWTLLMLQAWLDAEGDAS